MRPYVYQGAAGHSGWLTLPQMIDSLALGETTPGPLIIVVAFVGFVGAYVQQWRIFSTVVLMPTIGEAQQTLGCIG